MLRIAIPGRDPLDLEHVVCDMNGTLAEDGQILPGVAERLAELSGELGIHLLTADTHGTMPAVLAAIRSACAAKGTADPHWERVATGAAKAAYVLRLGGASVVALGNGANDEPMFRAAGLSIGVIGTEGLCVPTLHAADIVAASPLDALDLLRNPVRLTATLRL